MGHHSISMRDPSLVIMSIPSPRCTAYVWIMGAPNTHPRSGFTQQVQTLTPNVRTGCMCFSYMRRSLANIGFSHNALLSPPFLFMPL
jgi:hypothetical protein